jgi:hypothetical protein
MVLTFQNLEHLFQNLERLFHSLEQLFHNMERQSQLLNPHGLPKQFDQVYNTPFRVMIPLLNDARHGLPVFLWTHRKLWIVSKSEVVMADPKDRMAFV